MALRLLAIVREKGGSFVEADYINKRTPLWFRCLNGHEWKTQPQTVFGGSWCRQCWNENSAGAHLRLPDGLKQAKEIAESRGGRCLSDTYASGVTPMHWRCANGHEWHAALSDLKKATWCPECGSGARERLSRHYFESFTDRRFPKAKPTWLKNSLGNRMELDGYCEEINLAFEHQGEQHYREVSHFNRRDETLERRIKDDEDKRSLCAEHGISLIEVPYFISVDELPSWIRGQINRLNPSLPLKHESEVRKISYAQSSELSKLQEIARERDGECLSNVYLGVIEKHRFRCAKGHEWEAIASNIKSGTWCPACKPERIGQSNRKHSIGSMSNLAAIRGGKFLSAAFESVNSRYEWECRLGHRWIATPSDIMKGTWCPECANNSQRGTLKEMQEIAASRDGECISSEYTSSQTKLRWRCAKGHEWEARPDNVKNRYSWCPICARSRGGAV